MADNAEEQTFVQLFVEHPGAVRLGSWMGMALALVSLGLLLWAEHYAIATASGLEEGAGKVVAVQPDRVDPANEGKLVHVTGEATTKDQLTDPDFGVSAQALKLFRSIELYQWIEKKTETKKDDKTVVSYTYTKEWSKDKPKQDFEDKKDHVNPAELPFKELELLAADVKLGAFALSQNQIKELKGTEPLLMTQELLDQRPADKKGTGSVADEGKLFVSRTPGSTLQAPAVGDILTKYEVIRPKIVTVVSKQTGQTFEPYRSRAGTEIDIVQPGAVDTKAMFASAHGNSQAIHWVLRVLLILLLAPAVFLMIRPMALESGFDLMKKRNNIGFLAFGTVAATFVVFCIVGLRWLLYQPLFGIEMLAIGALGLSILYFVLRRLDKSGLFTPVAQFSAEELALFRQIALDPENFKLRLDLAGLLEKRGHLQGEFMRLDIETEGMAKNDHRRNKLEERWMALLNEHSRMWFMGLTKLGLWPHMGDTFMPYMWMNLGNIEKVEINKPKLLPQHADRLFKAAPGLRELEFHTIIWVKGDWKETQDEFDFPGIFALSHLEQIGILNVGNSRLKLDVLETIVKSPHLKNLKRLEIGSNQLGVLGAEVVAKSTALNKLNELNISSFSLKDEGAAALAKWPQLPKLTSLELSYNDLTSVGIRALTESNSLAGLTDLNLRSNEIGPEGAAALASAACLSNLTKLNLGSTNIGTAGLQALGNSPHLTNLTVLNLESCEIDAAGIQSLLSGRTLEKLEELDLSYNAIGDAGLESLARWPGLAHVKKLILKSNSITGASIRALADSPFAGALQELDLSNCEGGISAARALVASETLTKLTSLKIEDASLTPEGKQLLEVRFGEGVES